MPSGKTRSRSLIWAAEVVGEKHPNIRQWIRDGDFCLSQDDTVGRGKYGTDISDDTVRRLAHFVALRWIGFHPEQAGKLCDSASRHSGTFISAWDFRDAKNVKVRQGKSKDDARSLSSPHLYRTADIRKLRAHVETALGEFNASN